jgi:hypothetical protein
MYPPTAFLFLVVILLLDDLQTVYAHKAQGENDVSSSGKRMLLHVNLSYFAYHFKSLKVA